MTGWLSFGWWITCLAIAFGLGAIAARQIHDCPAQAPPTDRVNIYARCGCVRWQVVGHRVPHRAPCPPHMVLDEMERIVDAEGQRLHSGNGHHS